MSAILVPIVARDGEQRVEGRNSGGWEFKLIPLWVETLLNDLGAIEGNGSGSTRRLACDHKVGIFVQF